MNSPQLQAISNVDNPGTILAYSPDGPISAARFQADSRRLAELLRTAYPDQHHILNICQDRYHFMVGLAASLVTGKISLLPASHTAETVRQLRVIAPDVFCLHDGEGTAVDFPQIAYPAALAAATDEPAAPLPPIPANRVAAYVYTSGSTGAPVPHRKTWGALVQNAAAEVAQLGLREQPHSIVATVPPQHMYGFESTVLLCLFGNCPVWSGQPFYPADIARALAAIPRPRLLVTTPFHLRTLLNSGVAIPAIDRILSATAPLSVELACHAEQQLGAPVHEIYGCTETGQIASRQVTVSPAWRLMADIRLHEEDGTVIASGGHVEGHVLLNDVLELHADGNFLLLGRQADLINIAGKRTSLAYLNQQLLAIDQVEDGSFFMPDENTGNDITRLCAIVVAPQMNQRQLLAALRQRVDAAFLPRPLIFVERMPRNANGKITRASLAALIEQHRSELAARHQMTADSAE
ncbi:MAG: AMP-binding protein [Georgfuchsia sp.]